MKKSQFPDPRLRMKSRTDEPSTGFTLVELLVVLLIMGILIALVLPAVGSIARAHRLTIGEQMVVGQLNLARQVALTESLPVEVRFYSFAGDTGEAAAFRAVQSFRLKADGTLKPASIMQKLPTGVVLMNPTATPASNPSSLLATSRLSDSAKGDIDLPAVKAGSYRIASFTFRPDGSTALDKSSSWHTTLVTWPAIDQLPPNFATVQVDPLNGTTRSFRP